MRGEGIVPVMEVGSNNNGGFGNNEKNNIRNLSKKIIPIFVGIDANRTILKDISTNNIVYSVADFMQALNEARF